MTQGGHRKGAGRKPAPYPTQLIKVQATREELERIYQLSTRERTEAMLAALGKENNVLRKAMGQ